MIKNKVLNFLKELNYEIVYDGERFITLNSFVITYSNKSINLYYDIGLYPNEASSFTLKLYDFCKLNDIPFKINKSYFKVNGQLFFEDEAAREYLTRNYLEFEIIKKWDKILEESCEKDLHAC